MLEWLTFAAAALAAVGAVVGPFVAYRSAMAAVRREERQSVLDRQQTQVELAIQYAVSEDAVIAEMGIKQLTYLLDRGQLTAEQQMAAVSAIEARLARAADRLQAGVEVVQESRPAPELEG